MKNSEVLSKLKEGLTAFMKIDENLLYLNVNERSISHKLAMYLQDEFKEYDVDCEYNRKGSGTKRLEILQHNLPIDNITSIDTEAQTVFPDIIVHTRESDSNLLVIEIKKSNSGVNDEHDREKLEAFTKQDGEYGYQLGVFLCFYVNGENSYKIKGIFKDGKARKDLNMLKRFGLNYESTD